MTLGQQAIHKAKLEAMKQGRLEGIREGKLEGKREGKREGKLEGKREGKLEGRLKQAEETAIFLLKENMETTKVAKATNLPIDVILNLVKKLKENRGHPLETLRQEAKLRPFGFFYQFFICLIVTEYRLNTLCA